MSTIEIMSRAELSNAAARAELSNLYGILVVLVVGLIVGMSGARK